MCCVMCDTDGDAVVTCYIMIKWHERDNSGHQDLSDDRDVLIISERRPLIILLILNKYGKWLKIIINLDLDQNVFGGLRQKLLKYHYSFWQIKLFKHWSKDVLVI